MFCAGNSCLAPRLSRDRFFRASIMIFVLIKLKKPRNYRLRSLRNSTEITWSRQRTTLAVPINLKSKSSKTRAAPGKYNTEDDTREKQALNLVLLLKNKKKNIVSYGVAASREIWAE